MVLAVVTSMILAATAADKTEKPALVEYVTIGDVPGVLQRTPDGKGATLSIRLGSTGLQSSGGQHLVAHQKPTNPPKFVGTGKRRVQVMEFDFDVEVIDDVKVRQMKLSPKTDDKGKKVPYTADELVKLKGDLPLAGYEATIGDLKSGQHVRLHLVRVKGATGESANKAYASRIFIDAESPTVDKKPEKKN
jgi:hypothetical protein